MANALDKNLTDKTVVFKTGVLKPEFADMRFKVQGGFGASPSTSGTAIFGTFEDGEETRMSGLEVKAIVDDVPELNALVASRIADAPYAVIADATLHRIAETVTPEQ